MPTKDKWYYIGIEDNDTLVFWNPYYCKKEFRKIEKN